LRLQERCLLIVELPIFVSLSRQWVLLDLDASFSDPFTSTDGYHTLPGSVLDPVQVDGLGLAARHTHAVGLRFLDEAHLLRPGVIGAQDLGRHRFLPSLYDLIIFIRGW
jgi:hypothetical protein